MTATIVRPSRALASLRDHWRWSDALAMSAVGSRYRVIEAPFSIARDRCRQLGCAEGDVFTCVANGPEGITLVRSDGVRLTLEREISWFVRVEPYPDGARLF